MEHSALRHQAEDTVGIVIYPINAGSEIAVKDIATEEKLCLTVRENIPIFHKIALSDMTEGQDVIEYGQIIGRATADIPAGSYVHIHNIKTKKW
ncbi:MAG: UxaA family hydrolase [Christensenellaceae bacterium]|nr:UxaA family hydrolase [Christensenellaceae bacterium]